MSIQRIDSKRKRTHGFQARAYVAPGQRLTRFFSDSANGGKRKAHQLAKIEEERLQQRAKRMRRVMEQQQ